MKFDKNIPWSIRNRGFRKWVLSAPMHEHNVEETEIISENTDNFFKNVASITFLCFLQSISEKLLPTYFSVSSACSGQKWSRSIRYIELAYICCFPDYGDLNSQTIQGIDGLNKDDNYTTPLNNKMDVWMDSR